MLSALNADSLARAIGDKLKEIGSPLADDAMKQVIAAAAAQEQVALDAGRQIVDHAIDRFRDEILPALLKSGEDREAQFLEYMSNYFDTHMISISKKGG